METQPYQLESMVAPTCKKSLMDLLMDLQTEKKLERRSCTLREALETHADERNKASQSDAKKLEMQLYQLASMVAPMYHRASLMDSQTEKKVGKARPCRTVSLRLLQTSATRHPSEMKKSWKRNFINLKKAAA